MRPYFNEGRYYMGQYGNNYLIELYVLRENGIPLAGPNIKSLIKEISTQSLKAAIQKNLQEYWEANLSNFSKFKHSDYQVFAILTMCRTLYSLEKTGKISSKIEAAKWVMQRFDPHWKNLIELAIAWEPGQQISSLEETQSFIRYVLNKSREQVFIVNKLMKVHTLKSFGSNNLTGSIALVIEADNFTRDERLKFTFEQNKSACVFMQIDSDNRVC